MAETRMRPYILPGPTLAHGMAYLFRFAQLDAVVTEARGRIEAAR